MWRREFWTRKPKTHIYKDFIGSGHLNEDVA